VSGADAEALERQLADDLAAIGVGAGEGAFVGRALAFARLLAAWNARIRLVGPTELASIVREQVVDAMGFALALRDLAEDSFWDVGAGGGLPGLLLALYFPERRFVLVEPIHKKSAFLKHAAHALGLDNASVHTGRVEPDGSLHPPLRLPGPPPRAALSRATLAPEVWLATARHLVGPGGLALIALADQVPDAIARDTSSVEVGRWTWRVPATGAPRILLARRFSGLPA
jgi:16S rRNA (guanine(527)-N(7))-methyltransferase RsmG